MIREKVNIIKMRIALIAVVAVVALASIFVFLNYRMFLPVETADCGSDPSCIQGLETNMGECVPSSTIITGRTNNSSLAITCWLKIF